MVIKQILIKRVLTMLFFSLTAAFISMLAFNRPFLLDKDTEVFVSTIIVALVNFYFMYSVYLAHDELKGEPS